MLTEEFIASNYLAQYYMLEAENELIEGRASGLINTKVAAALRGFGGAVEGNIPISFVLFKEKNGKYDCIAYGYINKKKAEELRREALESAIDDSEIANDFNNFQTWLLSIWNVNTT